MVIDIGNILGKIKLLVTDDLLTYTVKELVCDSWCYFDIINYNIVLLDQLCIGEQCVYMQTLIH